MNRLQFFIAFGLTLLAGDVFAARPNYTYAGFGYTSHHLEDYDCGQDGIYLEGGLALDGQMILRGKHTDVTSGNGGCGSTTTEISFGFRNDFSQNSSVYALVSLVNRDEGWDSDAGIGLSGGIRTFFSKRLEINGSISYETIDSYSQLYLTGGAAFQIFPNVTLTGDLSANDEGNTGISFGGRYNF